MYHLVHREQSNQHPQHETHCVILVAPTGPIASQILGCCPMPSCLLWLSCAAVSPSKQRGWGQHPGGSGICHGICRAQLTAGTPRGRMGARRGRASQRGHGAVITSNIHWISILGQELGGDQTASLWDNGTTEGHTEVAGVPSMLLGVLSPQSAVLKMIVGCGYKKSIDLLDSLMTD